ncbi:hypothetical protein N7454_002967 [Penicillium verhagenii]|nr:hypothetical protein N7454_002967 [Penicillium verhagenii]
MPRPEFLTLRVLWPATELIEGRLSELTLHRFGLLAYHDRAEHWLDAFHPFQKYLAHVKSDIRTKPWAISQSAEDATGLGIMELTKRNQEIVIHAFKTHVLDNIDEEVVVSSLMTFLQAITMRHPGVCCDWSSRRKNFRVVFPTRSTLSVKVDGWLFNPITGHVKTLIEVKSAPRALKETYVSRQESAEIFAMIATHSPAPSSPVFLISQDGVELYVIVADFDQRYVDFARGRRLTITEDHFMKMHKFGPWLIDRFEDLDIFAKLVLAIAIHGSH